MANRIELDFNTCEFEPLIDFNIFYDSVCNNYTFHAAALHIPFFDQHYPLAYNYGVFGAIIGHEMSHGLAGYGIFAILNKQHYFVK